MDLDSQDIDIENLQQMPYTELRKLASKYGIQRMKADKLVSAIMTKVSSTDKDTSDCFSTPAAKLMNSSKKNKVKVFDETQKTPLATPRRGTFTVETPSFVLAGDLFETLEDSASVLDESNVTFSRGSERKLRSRKVSFMSPILTPKTPRSQSLRNRPKTPVAARTPLNESVVLDSNSLEPKRKSLSKSLSPKAKVAKLAGESDVETGNIGKNLSTPLSSSVQGHEKKGRMSRAKTSPKNVGDAETKKIGKNFSTPLPSSVQKSEKRARLSRSRTSLKIVGDVEMENVGKNFSTPLPSSVLKSEKTARPSRAKISPKNVGDEKAIPAVVNSSTPLPALPKVEKSMNISRSKISLNNNNSNTNKQIAVKEPTSLKKKQTPNFKKIHQKAFDKMESIDDYQKRKMLNSAKKLAQHSMFKSKVTKAKSKIPAFSGIPFISSRSSTKPTGCRIMSINKTSMYAPPRSKENVFKPAMHNKPVDRKTNLPKTPLSAKSKSETSLRKRDTPMSAKSKAKFDLKQSLSRKLNYRPHRGPLKPLSAANNTVHSTSILPLKEPVESKVVTKNRSQNRSLIRGVRMNKRFELQMKNRK